MKRNCTLYLQNWLQASPRLPLVLRGARQVGKTWLVRNLAEIEGKELIEINLEKKPHLASAFSSNDPEIILKSLARALEKPIKKESSLLFIDEIQAVPKIFASLRWFAEDMPELPVIAAGSLLEFALGEYEMSMPVGRVTYAYVEPLSFEEFLLAKKRDRLVMSLKEFSWTEELDTYTHTTLSNLFKEYVIIGGMPAAVSHWTSRESLREISRIHNDILTTFKADFNKYGRKMSAECITDVFEAIPNYLGQKFVYSKINPHIRMDSIKKAFKLLCKAKVCSEVPAVAGNGVPLKAEILTRYIKANFLDVGLCSSMLKLSLSDLEHITELELVNNGGIAEQYVGQLLRTLFPFYEDPELYYWVNPEKGATAELDYIVQHGRKVVPIEVKAGKSGTLKSLHRFMHLKKLMLAVRINAGLPHVTKIKVKDHEGNIIQYELRSLPFYLIGELHRLLNDEHS